MLSGALAAVIILFIVIPKGVQEDPELIKQVQELKSITDDVQDAIDKIQNSVPKEVFENIKDEVEHAKKKLKELNILITKLEEDVTKLSSENAELKQQVKKQQEDIDNLKQQVEKLNTALAEERANNKNAADNVEKTLGVFAQFGIICKWDETDTDVDIGIQKFGMEPEQCWRNYPSKKWGILGEDVKERVDEDTKDRFELFYVPKIYPDQYTLWANIYEQSRGDYANITCIFIFHPGKSDEIRKEIGPLSLSGNSAVLVTSFKLSYSGFEILDEMIEPYWGHERVIK